MGIVAHLEVVKVQVGDIVIGTLPVNLAAQVCARGARFFNLSLEVPEEARGRELSAEDLERFGARIEECRVLQAKGWVLSLLGIGYIPLCLQFPTPMGKTTVANREEFKLFVVKKSNQVKDKL